MMLHPSYTDLMNSVNGDSENAEHPVVNSRYSIAIATAKRARQIIDDENVKIGTTGKEVDNKINCSKALSQAINEIYTGEVKILTDEEYDEMINDPAYESQQ